MTPADEPAPAPLRVLVTRPAAQAERAVRELRAAGLDAVALPLLSIEPDPEAQPRLGAEWAALPTRQFAMFVSAAAVEAFFASPRSCAWPAGVRAGSTGPGTTAALRRAGVPAGLIDEPGADAVQFDTEALWARIGARPWQGASVLIVRGEGGRDWLAETLRAAGATVQAVELYRRGAPHWTEADWAVLQQACAEPARHWWQLTSSQAIDNLVGGLAARGLVLPWPRAQAVASHPRIAERARAAGFGSVLEVLPGTAALVAALRR